MRFMARWSMMTDSHAPSFLEIAEPNDALFVVNSFSKPWAMTGWRIGWLIHPPALAEPMEVMTIANNTGPTVFAQRGAIAALSPQGDAFRAEMLERCRAGSRDHAKLPGTGITARDGSSRTALSTAFVQIEGLKDSLAFAQDLVRRFRLGVSPGMAFGPSEERENDLYLRLCFAQDPALLAEGLSRLERETCRRFRPAAKRVNSTAIRRRRPSRIARTRRSISA